MNTAKQRTLSEVLTDTPNAIGFIRLAMALFVLVGHSLYFHQGKIGPLTLVPATANQVALGRFPVDVFFCLSGFLVAASFDKAQSWPRFLWHRFLRIYPAFWVCIALTAFVVAPIWGERIDPTYFWNNFALFSRIDHGIDGLFLKNPGGKGVNGALWTLPWEIRAYAGIGFLGLLGAINKKTALSAFLICYVWFVVVILRQNGVDSTVAVLSGQRLLCFFLAGTVCYCYRDKIPVDDRFAVVCIAALLISIYLGVLYLPRGAGLFYVAAPFFLSYLSFWAALRLPFTRVNTRNDYSYGIYIYGTLVLQIIASLDSGLSLPMYLASALAITFVLAYMSWNLIERPALKLKRLL